MRMDKNLLKERVIDVAAVLIIPFLLIQILPGLIQNIGLDLMSASLIASAITTAVSIAGYAIMLRSTGETVPNRGVRPIFWVIIGIATVGFLLYDQLIFIWINNHIVDAGLEARAESIANVNLYTYLVYGLIVAPIAEECLFRVFFYKRLKLHFSWIVSMVVTSVMFGIIHMTISHVVTATLFGIFLTLIYEYTQTIWVTIVCHIFYNLSTLALSGGEMEAMAGNTLVTAFIFFAGIFVLGWFIAKRDLEVKSAATIGKGK